MISRARIANRRPGGLWWRVPVALVLWLVLTAPLVAAAVALAILRDWAADLPRVPDLDRWDQRLPRTSLVLAHDGSVLAELPFVDGDLVGHRFPVAFDELPPMLVHAFLAAEDARFFAHDGVDLRAIVRAARANVAAGRVVEGASTLTQQVARNLLPDAIGHERSLRRKVREALLARRIERRYSKQRIFTTYVNQAFLGAGAYGVAAAARAYFSRPLAQLNLAQTALIAGLAQAPGRADPYRDRAAALARRSEVLDRMLRAGFIDSAAHAAAKDAPLELTPPHQRYGGVAPWLTERARREVARAYPAAFARGGLIIETSAQPVLAVAAAEAATRWSQTLGKRAEHAPPQVGALLWDYRTGYLEALIGGTSWAISQFDRASQACRQPGSAFKPIVYAAALAAHAITPATLLRDAPIAAYDENRDVFWKPANSGRAFRGVALAHDALVASLNAPAVDVFDRVGAPRVIELARRLGITTELAEVRPMALGASCVVPLELAGAYAAIARGGIELEPVVVVRVQRAGRTYVDRASPLDPQLAPARRLDRLATLNEGMSALDAGTAFQVASMLRDVVRRGTATAARALGRPAAGKTGTTNDNTDAWFLGFTARVVAAVWVGYDDPSRGLGRKQDGAHAALPLWMQLVQLGEAERPSREVPQAPPLGLQAARIDRDNGLLAGPGSSSAIELHFVPGTAPLERSEPSLGTGAEGFGRTAREF